MGKLTDLVLDAWTALGYKAPLSDEDTARIKRWQAQSWVPAADRRRLAAYLVLAAYEANAARAFIEGTDDDRSDNREYGDAALIVDQVLSHLLGETQEIVVPGAEDFAAVEAATDSGSDDDEAAAQVRFRAERQTFLREWAEQVHLDLLLVDSERNAVQYGDGVYLLGWDAEKERVTCAVMDPGFYFPVLPDSIDTYAYPDRVHFAWELPGEDFADGKPRVRRITYELGPILPREVETEDGESVYELLEGDRWVDDGSAIERTYPWDEKPSRTTCYVTDATWVLDSVRGSDGFDSLTAETAVYAVDDEGQFVDRLDMGIDFIPVVHVPNTPAGGHHFGQSSLSRVLQIIDDLQNADTDAQRASATAGSPMIGLAGSRVNDGDYVVRPGMVFGLGENGSATVIDTSGPLRELRAYVEALRDRLATNSRLPAAVIGLMDPSEAPSGYAMQLSFGPLSSMIRQMRLTRSVKYPLLLKMVQRLYQANGKLDAGETPRAEVRLGAFLPEDQAGTLSLVREAYEAGLISLETAVQMLVDVGFPVDDALEEIERIQSRDYEGANALADATGDADAVRAYLGLPEATGEVQPIVLGGPPGGPPAPVPPVPRATQP